MKANSSSQRPSRWLRAHRPGVLALAGVLLVALASCTAPPPYGAPPPRAPAPPRAAAPPPPPPAVPQSWRDAPLTPGTWRWMRESGSSVARYDGQVMLACTGRAVTLALSSPAAPPPAAPPPGTTPPGTTLTITTSDTSRSFALGGAPTLTLSPHDPILDAIAFSRGRFMVAVTGGPRLILPAWAEVARVIEDCR